MITLSRAMVYVATSAFFAVAATAQLHGDSIQGTFLKAGLACALLTMIGMIVLRMLDDVTQKATASATSSREPAHDAASGSSAGSQPGEPTQAV